MFQAVLHESIFFFCLNFWLGALGGPWDPENGRKPRTAPCAEDPLGCPGAPENGGKPGNAACAEDPGCTGLDSPEPKFIIHMFGHEWCEALSVSEKIDVRRFLKVCILLCAC